MLESEWRKARETALAARPRSMAYAPEIEQLFHLTVVRYQPIRRHSWRKMGATHGSGWASWFYMTGTGTKG
jgi:hypothetical protein